MGRGQVGGALKLDGISWLEVPHDDSLTPKDQITLMCWANFDAGALGESSEVSLIYKNGPFILEGRSERPAILDLLFVGETSSQERSWAVLYLKPK